MSRLSVSVVIPTYNRSALVGRAVDCSLRECSTGDEVIVVDDGSTDQTEAALAPYRERILYVRISHGGAGKARNHGVGIARNPLVAFLDSDDEWMLGKLCLQCNLMQARADVLFCFSDFAVRDKAGREYRHYLARWHRESLRWKEILGPGVPFSSIAPLPQGCPDFLVHVGDLYPSQLAAPHVLTSTVVVRREEAGDALWFAEDLPTYEDWECFGRLARAGAAAYLDCETAWQYGHAGPRLTDADELQEATARIAMLQRVWGADPAFLARYRDRFESILQEERLRRSRALLVRGRTREAREQLRLVKDTPSYYRILASLPGPITCWLLAIRRSLRKLFGMQRVSQAPQATM